MTKPLEIYCVQCRGYVPARLTSGAEIYPHRADLARLPFWKCDTCKNYVGCHFKTRNPTRPLGCIPNPELKKARMALHALIDPIWKSGRVPRTKLYDLISKRFGWTYHTASIRSVEQAREIYRFVQGI